MPHNMFVVVNPCSGKARIKTKIFDIVKIFSYAGYKVTIYPTKSRGDATLAVASLSDEYDTLVCCGGDGTLNEVITGLMRNKNRYRLGYIPAGTLNEWSSGLGISKNEKKAAEDIVNGIIIPLDIGRFGNRYFTYTASFGAFTEASYSADQNVKNVLGQAAYFFEGVKSVGNIKPIHLKLVCNQKEIEGDFLFGSISNSMSVGGVVHFDDTVVKLNDGMFEVMLIRQPSNIAELNGIIDGILKKDLNRSCIEFFHTEKIEIIGGSDVSWTLDGEYAGGEDRVTVENLHGAVTFIVPDIKRKNTK